VAGSAASAHASSHKALSCSPGSASVCDVILDAIKRRTSVDHPVYRVMLVGQHPGFLSWPARVSTGRLPSTKRPAIESQRTNVGDLQPPGLKEPSKVRLCCPPESADITMDCRPIPSATAAAGEPTAFRARRRHCLCIAGVQQVVVDALPSASIALALQPEPSETPAVGAGGGRGVRVGGSYAR
jgi:hypothetical protein